MSRAENRFDVIIAGDFRVPGGTSRHVANEIQVLAARGLSVGLAGVQLPHAKGRKPLDPLIRRQITLRNARLVSPTAGRVSSSVALFENPRAFMERPQPALRIHCNCALMIVHVPLRDGAGNKTFEPQHVTKICQGITDTQLEWVAVSPLVLRSLKEETPSLNISSTILRSIIFAEEFSHPRRTWKAIPVIGRHSRPQPEKWPATRQDFLKSYPIANDIAVKLLGVGSTFDQWFPRLPENWQVFPFTTESVAEFLKSIDYFVYFHHPRWVEALGIATVEAMAAGAIAILPEYMRENFGSAAQYSTPGQSIALVKSLHGKRSQLGQQRYRGLQYVKKFHSPSAYLDSLNGFLDRSAQSRPRRDSSVGARRIMVIADFSDTGLHRFELYCMMQDIIQCCDEVILYSSSADKTPIGNFWRNNPVLKARARWGEAATDIQVDLVIVDLPYVAAVSPIDLNRIFCSCAVVILNELLNIQETQNLDNLLKENFRHVTWAPRSRTGRIHLENLQLPELGIEPYDWEPSATSMEIAGSQKQRSEIFLICNSDIDRSRSLKNRTIEALPGEAPCTIVELGRIIGESPRSYGARFHFSPAELTPELMLRRAKIIIIAYHLTPPVRLIVDQARAVGIMILDVFSTDKGPSKTWQDSNDLRKCINALWMSKKSLAAPAKQTLSLSSFFSRKGCVHRLVYWKHSETTSLSAPAHRVQPATAILMLSQNGVGLGHVVRQLAIARQMDPDRKVIFCCIGQAFDIVRMHGYHVEHIPSHLYNDIPYHAWNRWLAAQLLQIIYFHKIGTIVFDGSTPYEGLLDALQTRPETKAVWIRRAMWADAADVSNKKLRAGKLFDLVIEPQDLAEQYDTGPTPAFRRFTSRVKPISLVEPSDKLSRQDSCLILGIDPNKTSVLLQLGSGNNRNLTLIIDRIVAALAARGEFQIVESEWINSQFRAKIRPDIVRLRGFPTAIHFNAFNFCFSAAGYNSFHEVINLGLPTIFIPNRREYMDNQLARATFASEKGAAIICDGSPASISRALDQIYPLQNRKSMQAAMRKLRLANGAMSAASLIARLAET